MVTDPTQVVLLGFRVAIDLTGASSTLVLTVTGGVRQGMQPRALGASI